MLNDTYGAIKIFDTSDFSPADIARLTNYGCVQIQATDPQSVLGGIPCRVFECAASGKTLLADFKPELDECFAPETEYIKYNTICDYPFTLCMSTWNKEGVGHAMRERFLKEHTWQHRIDSIENVINSSNSESVNSVRLGI